jgi:hypothetical protein
MLRSTARKSSLILIGSLALLLPQAANAADRISIPFDPSRFSHPLRIDNTFFSLQPGTTQVFRGKGDEGCELDRVTVTHDTRQIDGITARAVHDVVFEDEKCNGNLAKAEDTLDFYAQDDAGNVWYMGEHSEDCEDGKCTRNEGSWVAGKDIFNVGTNAKPGIIMLAHPRQHEGDRYRQEFYPGHAEDEAIITNTDVTVTLTRHNALKPGVFHHCIKTKELSALEPEVVGFKYYCPQVGFVLETEQPGDFRSERVELSAVQTNDALQFRSVPR